MSVSAPYGDRGGSRIAGLPHEDREEVAAPYELRAAPTVLRMMLGAQLRRLRETSGVTPEAAGYEIRASRSKISRLEHGRVGFKERDVADLLTLYGVTDPVLREGMLTLARRSNAQGWWASYDDVVDDWFQAYLGLEETASLIRSFELQFVHGLFQTEEYARAVTELGHSADPPGEVARRVKLRLTRQQLLSRPDAPPVWSIMDEAVLRRPVGSPAVMRAQLSYLAEMAELPHITFQVVPFAHGGHAAAGGSFTILRFSELDLSDVVYIEQLTGALYLDKRGEVDHYMGVMNRLSVEALTPARSLDFIRDVAQSL